LEELITTPLSISKKLLVTSPISIRKGLTKVLGCSKDLQGIPSMTSEELILPPPIRTEELFPITSKVCEGVEFNSPEHIGEVSSNFFDMLEESPNKFSNYVFSRTQRA
jgi:hypothetical protein